MSNNDSFVDWRILWGARFAQDLPEAYPDGPSITKGDPFYHSTLTQNSEGELIGFITPSPAALALNIAIQSAKRATKVKETLKFRKSSTPHGEGKSVLDESTPALFDYFESCMISVTFSVQALEVFCNTVIVDNLKGTLPIKENKKIKNLNPKEIQERKSIPLPNKLNDILPRILSIPSPKDNSDELWKELSNLLHTRNATIHMKSSDAFNGSQIDKETLFYEFFRNDPVSYSQCALRIIQYFSESVGNPMWIQKAAELLEKGD
jgi:hypothetical protein